MNERIAKLYQLGDPRELDEKRDDSDWNDCLQYGFTQADVPGLIDLVCNKSLHLSEDQKEVWVPLYAWRALGQLGSVEAVEPLLSMLHFFSEEHDDWAFTEIPIVMGMIGTGAIKPIAKFLCNDSNKEITRAMAAEALEKIPNYHPECRGEVIEAFRTYTSSPDLSAREFNGLLICSLIDVEAVELIDDIRNMFKQDAVLLGIAGDLEDVEIELGLRDERETPKSNYNILSELGNDDFFGDTSEVEQNNDLLSYKGAGTFIRETPKVGRNDPCPCGSGKKYKKCCLN